MATTVLQLRTTLTTALSGLVGTYTLANGATTPAIAVRNPGEGHPPRTRVTGLEVVIVRDPAMDRVVQGYTNANAIRDWDVFLVAWDNTANLEAATAAIVGTYPIATVDSVAVPEGAGPRAQRRITIPTNP